MRSETFTAVRGRRTFPASAMGGSPSAPVIASAGRHVWATSSSSGSACAARMPETNGIREPRSPSTTATSCACRARSAGIATWKSRGRISPVRSSSRRESSWRRIRKLEGTMPLAPEWMPSSRTSTDSSPPTRPRSDVAVQSWS